MEILNPKQLHGKCDYQHTGTNLRSAFQTNPFSDFARMESRYEKRMAKWREVGSLVADFG